MKAFIIKLIFNINIEKNRGKLFDINDIYEIFKGFLELLHNLCTLLKIK